ncbi:MAG: HEAT repeat domain-containing protein [Alphaproteobacteria bacterium]|nr:HEAT repeat domain-containing protein [Alphaproteobacteria bacterium]
MTPLLLLALAGLGCDTADPLDDRRAELLALWEADPAAAERALAAVEDPIERQVLVLHIAEQAPGRGEALCALLPVGPTQRRCERIQQRPHLRASAERIEDDAALGLAFSDAAQDPWVGVQPVEAPCPHPDLRVSCQNDAARVAAVAHEGPAAAAACLALDEQRWRQECFFLAAEAWISGAGPAELAGGLPLCHGAGDFRDRCALHALLHVDRFVPLGEQGRPPGAGWEALLTLLGTLRTELAPWAPGLAEDLPGLAAARALRLAYAEVTELTGDPLSALPEALHPHVRAALAWRLWQLEGDSGRDLAAWEARLQAALAARPGSGGALPAERPPPPAPLESLWDSLLPEEAALPRVRFLGRPWRLVHPDPAVDALIALLEVAGRHHRAPGSRPLLEAALRHPEPFVRHTAARLLAARGRRAVLAPLAEDPDPAVRARVAWRPPPAP